MFSFIIDIMSDLITPRVLKGFRDYPPKLEIRRQLLCEKLQKVFRKFGFLPIDTPAMEYAEVLLRKSEGETEKQVFRFNDQGGRDVALRFDLTVPLARFVAEHKNEIHFPFKRYHIANVWRGEKPQAGRFREFMQCDFDIIGVDNAESDFEIVNLIVQSFLTMGVDKIKVHISHRGLFNKLLEKLSIREKSEDVLRVVDKLAKVGEEEVRSLLLDLTSVENVKEILDFICVAEINNNNNGKNSFLETLMRLEKFIGGVCEESERLKKLYALLKAVNKADFVVLNPSITRGLDYYTGIVFETFLTELPSIGSVCSGGRYNNLTGLYMKENIPGVGASVGLDRLIAALEELNTDENVLSFTKAVIFYDKNISALSQYLIANFLTEGGFPTEVYCENKKMNAQYAWAESKGIPFGIFIKDNIGNSADLKSTTISLRDLRTREQKDLSLQEILTGDYK